MRTSRRQSLTAHIAQKYKKKKKKKHNMQSVSRKRGEYVA